MAGNGMSARQFLAKEIRLAREAKRISRAALGKALFVSGELVAAGETGRSIPRPEHLAFMIRILDFRPEIVSRLLEDLVSGEVSPEWTGKWLAVEAKANTLLSVEHSIVPGLLQTEDYTREVLRHNHHSPIDIEEQVQERLRRQSAVLDRVDSPMAVFVLDEQVLLRPVGGPKVMSDQLAHLVQVSARPKMIVHIVPAGEAGYHPGLAGAFMIARFDGTEVAYQDGTLKGHVFEDVEQVSAMSQIWENVRAVALPRAASIELIAKAVERWRS